MKTLWYNFAFGFAVIAFGAVGLSCKRNQAVAEPTSPQPPPGEVWLTHAQVKDAKIDVATVGEQDVNDTILTSGTVTFGSYTSTAPLEGLATYTSPGGTE